MKTDEKAKAIEDWLSLSASDLKAAKVLYDTKIFNLCLYHLQQGNEKLVKALLLSLGFMTPKTAKEDWTVKSFLGFLPKQPRAYGHRTVPVLISDLEKTIPALERYMTLLKNSDVGPRVASFFENIRASKRNLQKLKKKPFHLIETTEQLENEVRALQSMLGALDPATNAMKTELEKLDTAEIFRVATSLVRDHGFKVDTSQPPDWDKIKTELPPRMRLFMLAMLSVAASSILDPLESITRYPDGPHIPYDENHPYIKNFIGLHGVIVSVLEKGTSCLKQVVQDESDMEEYFRSDE